MLEEPSVVSTRPLTTDSEKVSTTSTPTIGQQENETIMLTITSNSQGVSVALIGTVVGGVGGSFLVLILVLFIPALVWMTKRYKGTVSEDQYNNIIHLNQQKLYLDLESEQREAVQHQQLQHQGDEVMEMKSNDAYISNTQQIPTEDNTAYGQATPQIPTEDNVAYGQIQSD